jgi:hypothetical protein
MKRLQAQCERLVAQSLLQSPSYMQQALGLVIQYPNVSENLCRLCCRHLAASLGGSDGYSLEQIRTLVQSCRDALQIGFEDVLTSCLRSRYRYATWPPISQRCVAPSLFQGTNLADIVCIKPLTDGVVKDAPEKGSTVQLVHIKGLEQFLH